MADEDITTPVVSTISNSISDLVGHPNHNVVATETLMFANNAISSSNPMLPQDLITIHGLDTTDAGTTFTVSDIVSSTGGTMQAIMTGTDQLIPVQTDANSLGVSEFQLVDNGNGELVLITATLPSKQSTVMLDDGTSALMDDQTQTVTLNLEEATQLLLQQQGLTLGQTMIDKDGLPVEVLHAFPTSMASSMEPTYVTQGPDVNHVEEGGNTQMVVNAVASDCKAMENDYVDSGFRSLEQQTESTSADQNEEGLVDTNNEDESCNNNTVELGDCDNTLSTLEGKDDVKDEPQTTEDYVESAVGNECVSNNSNEAPRFKKKLVKPKPKEPKIKEEKVPDLQSPIPLTDQTIVMINGKKCVLAMNQETQQMCAYPIKAPDGMRKRGRPKLTEEERLERKKKETEIFELEEMAPSEQAAETLLELSSVGADGVRRSARKRRKAKLLEEYEELEDSDEEVPFVDNQEKDPDITLNLPDKRIKLEKPGVLAGLINHNPVPQKRGRGRPRRYPPASQSNMPASIPAMLVPSANGQTLFMAEIPGYQNLQNLQHQIPNLVPATVIDSSAITGTSQTVSSEDSSHMTTLALATHTHQFHNINSSGDQESKNPMALGLRCDTEPSLCIERDEMAVEGEPIATAGTDSITGLSSVQTDETATQDSNTLISTSDKPIESSEQVGQPVSIQIPDNLLPMLGIKKDPIKIGLKSSETELEKFKCPKCDFQGFYAHQYRAHIATHGDDIHKCKCCRYVSLDPQELLAHFKEFHPRCICPECDFMAEHAYIIKRHMMRHNAKSCTCHLCGKVYKDMYILKMHVKMVHLPAEVLFECNVCSKKFTRKAHLKRHLRIHEPEKPFKCPHCEYRGCERSDISKHMLIHEEPKHVCERCGKTFRHIKNKELHVKRHYGQRDYKCGVCDFFGYTFTDIRKHIERKHQDMKIHICNKCNKQFRSENALKEHQLSCNVMLIEQFVAIPTSNGGTSQATIQLPAILGPDGQQLILNGQSLEVDGHTISMATQHVSIDDKTLGIKQEGVSIVTDDHLGLAAASVGQGEEEEEGLIKLEGEGGTMRLIGDTILTESGQLQVISHEALEEHQIINMAVSSSSIHQDGSNHIQTITNSKELAQPHLTTVVFQGGAGDSVVCDSDGNVVSSETLAMLQNSGHVMGQFSVSEEITSAIDNHSHQATAIENGVIDIKPETLDSLVTLEQMGVSVSEVEEEVKEVLVEECVRKELDLDAIEEVKMEDGDGLQTDIPSSITGSN